MIGRLPKTQGIRKGFMAILKIARMGHPVLQAPAEAVADAGAPEITRLIADMIETMADAAGAILRRDSRTSTGHFFIDEDVLREEGVTDFDQYAVTPGTELRLDFFL